MRKFLTQHDWISLPTQERLDLIRLFGIKRSLPTDVIHINGESRVLSDGVSDQDLQEAFGIPEMIMYLGGDFPGYKANLLDHLLSLVEQKMYGRLPDPEPVITEQPRTESAEPRRRGRPRKAAIAIPGASQSFGGE